MFVGLKSAVVHVNVNGKTHVFGHSYLGTSKAELKNLHGANTAINGSNEVQDYYEESTKPTVTLTVNDIPQKVLDELMGSTTDDDGWSIGGNDDKPSVGLAIVSPRYKVQKDHVWVFPNTKVTYQNVTLSTNTESKKQMQTVALTFNVASAQELGGKMYMEKDVDTDQAMQELMQSKKLNWTEGADDGEFTATQQVQKSGSHA